MAHNWTDDERTYLLWVYFQTKDTTPHISSTTPLLKEFKEITRISSANSYIGHFRNIADAAPQRDKIKGNPGRTLTDLYYSYLKDQKLLESRVSTIKQDLKAKTEANCKVIADMGISTEGLSCETILGLIKARPYQTTFRNNLLKAYEYKCCITGMPFIGTHGSALEACHITRYNPEELEELQISPTIGILMNALCHKLYDSYGLTITPEYKILVSPKLLAQAEQNDELEWLVEYKNNDKNIRLPKNSDHYPDKKRLDAHTVEYNRRMSCQA